MSTKTSPLFRHLQLRPHSERLLTSSAEFWFFSACILVFVMATAEAIAWGYLGSLFGDGVLRWVGAAFTGGTVFAVVWMIDVSLITLDRASREHTETILRQKSGSKGGRALREILTFTLRVALLIGSLTITAPYLAQIVFHRDIQRTIDAAATNALNDYRRKLGSRFDDQLNSRIAEINTKRSALENEVAGKGLSGRYGMGPAAKALAIDITKLELERDELTKQRQSALSAFDAIAQDWRRNRERMAAEYNLQLPQTTVIENGKALNQLRDIPENRGIEMAIQAFLAFIFTGMLLLKLFEPSSVRLYLSDVLQQEFNSYLAGTFDVLLPPTERSGANGFKMPPQRLYDFLINVWVPARKAEEGDADVLVRKLASESGLKALEDVKADIEKEAIRARSDLQVAHAAETKSARDFEDLKSAIAIVEADIRKFQSKLTASPVMNELRDRSRFKDDESRLEYDKNRLEIQSNRKMDLAAAKLTLSRLVAKRSLMSDNLRHATAEVVSLGKMSLDKEAELVEAIHRIRDVRRRTADAVREKCQMIIDAPENYRPFRQRT